MSDEPNKPDVLATLRERERALELEAVIVRSRIEEVREMILQIERAGRRKPGPKPRIISSPVVPMTKPTSHGMPPTASTEPTDAA